MKSLVLVFLCILLTSCGTMKSTTNTSSNEDNKLILPPDTPSNKYSKTRQTKND